MPCCKPRAVALGTISEKRAGLLLRCLQMAMRNLEAVGWELFHPDYKVFEIPEPPQPERESDEQVEAESATASEPATPRLAIDACEDVARCPEIRLTLVPHVRAANVADNDARTVILTSNPRLALSS
jgi:hypothetical protein